MESWTNEEPYPAGFVPALMAETWKRHQANEKPAACGYDGFPIYATNPRHAEHRLITDFIEQCRDGRDFNLSGKDVEAAGRQILELGPEAKVRAILAILERLPWSWKTGVTKRHLRALNRMAYHYENPDWRWKLEQLLTALLRSPPAFRAKDFSDLLTALKEPPDRELLHEFVRPKCVVRIAQVSWPDGMVPESVLPRLTELARFLEKQRWASRIEDRKVMEELGALTGKPKPQSITPVDAWSDAALADLGKMAGPESIAWLALLAHCKGADGSKPTKSWLMEAKRLVDEIGQEQFKARVLQWFVSRNTKSPDPDLLFDEGNATVLRGLVWSFSGWKSPEISTALANLAEVCFKKVRWLGPRCPRVGNACLYTLSTTPSEDAAAQLSRLDSTVKQPTAKKRIGKSLDKASELSGQTREDLEESTIPAYGLDMNGHGKQAIGNYTAEFSIVGADAFKVSWRKADGKTQKSVPAEVKEKHATELKAFKRTLQDVEKMLTAQRRRIERLLMTEREWDLETWRKRYLDHPLLADLTRRLIWHFKLGEQSATGAWLEGKLVDAEDHPLDWLAPETRVRLWHPIGFPVETVAAWRDWLQKHEVCQPFKQAHREIYALTDAELQTGAYSNRFAAHIIRRHQFGALAKDRGWTYLLQGRFDSDSVPTLQLPRWNLAVEFWLDYPGGDVTESTSQSGIFLHMATDQVRFVRDGEALLLSDVPAIVFTEVMRDVDLFVGVASIGNDPTWQDHGEIEGANAYWQSFSFGDLSVSAKTRKEVLEKLLPKLKIAAQCSFDEKFLVVRGKLRTYKIHLGSGNIQMEPNDQYLCIVPDRGLAAKHGEKLFLPFEGDTTLAVILSKAFLLADDSKIKDPTILSQIRK
ncbi:MAG TPA: DUF4132 domain-containing protein [Verrucomicrobiae bacterium]|nr:DUF4132 domain-containing protein [Verrucomicrobiae bacterium]